MRQWIIRMKLFVFLHRPSHFVFDVPSYFQSVILIQQNKTAVSIYNDFSLHFLATLKNIFQTLINFANWKLSPSFK